MRGWCSASSTLVPGSHLLQKCDADDAHGPLEILGPCSNDGREWHSAETEEGLGLEVPKQRHGVGSYVRGGVGVS